MYQLSIRSRSRKTKALLAGGAAALLLATSMGVASAADRPAGALAVSTSPDRSSAASLARYKASGSIYVFVNRNNVSEVSFYLDDKTQSGAAYSVERYAAYDFATTNPDGSARAFDTKTIADGTHNITAVVKNARGNNRVFSANFTVQNSSTNPTTSTTVKPTTTTTSAPTTSTSTSTTVAPTTSSTVAPTTSTTAKPTTTTTAKPSTTTTQVPGNNKNCLAKPSACGLPDATNTGWQHTGVVLKPSGSIKVTQPGTVIDGLDIKGEVSIEADNVTIKRSRITSGDYYPIRHLNGNKGLLVEDTEIAGTNGDVTSAISFTDYTARRVNVHGSADGLKADNNVLIEDSYIHDLALSPGSHNDGIQSTGGSNVTIRHNTIDVGSDGITSCIILGNEWAPQSNITIANNLLNGGGWSIYLPDQGTNRSITGNRFGRDYGYGIATLQGTYTWSGNVWDDTGLAAND